MKKLKECKRKFKIDAVPYEFTVIVSNDVTTSRNKLDKIFGHTSTQHFAAMHSSSGQGFSYIILPEKFELKYIVHEAFHCVWEICEFIGANHNNEFMAYLLSYIVDKIGDVYYRYDNKKFKK